MVNLQFLFIFHHIPSPFCQDYSHSFVNLYILPPPFYLHRPSLLYNCCCLKLNYQVCYICSASFFPPRKHYCNCFAESHRKQMYTAAIRYSNTVYFYPIYQCTILANLKCTHIRSYINFTIVFLVTNKDAILQQAFLK